ncbi:MAG: hypothetical protein H7Z14_03415, partial [Anaerolineae bacterium]|nr:hypothetical protein [Phycisphaerae bacterium]
MSKRARPFIIQSLEARVFLAADPIGPIQPILSDSGPAIRATLAAVPSGWTAGDIGAPAVAGSSDFNGATWSVAGGGTDIWNASDQFQFVSRSLEGDGAIIVRVASITNTSQYAKAGVMIRNGTAANAAFADLVVTSSQSVTFQWRATAGASAQAIYVNGIVSAPIWLQINRTGSLFTASYSYDGALWLQAGTGQSISMNSTARAGLAVSAVNSGALNTATFTNVSLTPNNWLDSDIGSPALAGSSTFDASTWTLSAGGTGIGGTSDSFNFANQTYVGDVTLIARVDSLTNTAAGAEAGLMIRDGAAANAGVALVAIAPSGAVSFDYRTSAGAASASGGTIADIGASRWLKLARSGNSFTAFYSQNGTTWNPIGTSRTIVMNKTINLGIAAAAGTNAARTTATFSRVSVLPGGWEDADIGAPAQAGSATFDGLTWTIRGGGGDIWSDQQQFNFAHQRYVGDFTITTRVRSLQSTGVFAKSGIMIRERPGTNSPYAFVFLTPSSVNFEYRNAASGASTGGGSVAGVGAPTFLKLVRTGNTFRAYYSNDGAAWTQIGAGINLTMGAAVCTGLAVGANDAAKLNAATFTDTSVTAAGVDLFLKTNGRNIRTAHGTGDIVRLRGVNLGGWLLHEAW